MKFTNLISSDMHCGYFGRLPIEIFEEAIPKTEGLTKEGSMSQDPDDTMYKG